MLEEEFLPCVSSGVPSLGCVHVLCTVWEPLVSQNLRQQRLDARAPSLPPALACKEPGLSPAQCSAVLNPVPHDALGALGKLMSGYGPKIPSTVMAWEPSAHRGTFVLCFVLAT